MNSKRESYIQKLTFKVSKCRVHHACVWGTWDLEVNKLVFHQLTQESHLQSMDAWISSRLSRLQEIIFFRSFRKRLRDNVFSWSVMTELQENRALSWQRSFPIWRMFSRGWTSSVKTRPWKHLKGCFLILKSLNSDNLWRRLQESIKALGFFKELWKFFRTHALEGKQSKWSFSEHMPAKENSQDEWLLSGAWPIYRLVNGY